MGRPWANAGFLPGWQRVACPGLGTPRHTATENAGVVPAVGEWQGDEVGAEEIWDVQPGELVVADDRGVTSMAAVHSTEQDKYIFEFIYFSRPDVRVFDENVDKMRRRVDVVFARDHSVKRTVDDSIARGSTKQKLVQVLNKAGDGEVHPRICSQPFQFPCFNGLFKTPLSTNLRASILEEGPVTT